MADVQISRLQIDAAGYEAGARRIVQANQQMAAADKAAATAEQEHSRATTELAQALNQTAPRLARILAQYDETARAAVRLANEERSLDRAMASGRITAEQHAQAVTLIRTANQATVASLNASRTATTAQVSATRGATQAAEEHSRAERIRTQQMAQLSYQINDVVTGLLSGQKPFMIFAQQGGQIAQIYGGLGTMFRSLVSPIGLATAGMAALAATVALVISRAAALESAGRRIGATQALMGNASGLTTSQVQGTIFQQSQLPGFGRGDTQDATLALLGNRNVQGSGVRDALEAARQLALITGSELPAALQKLAPLLSGTASGVQQLDSAWGFLTQEERDHIVVLEQLGRKSEVVNVALQALLRRLGNEGERSMGSFALAIDAVSKAFDAMLTNLSRNPYVQQKLNELILLAKAIQYVADKTGGAPALTAEQQARVQLDDLNRQIDELTRRRDTYRQQGAGYPAADQDRRLQAAVKQAQDLREELDGLANNRAFQEQAAQAKALAERLAAADKATLDLAKSLNPASAQIAELGNQAQRLMETMSETRDPTKWSFLAQALQVVITRIGQLHDQIDQVGEATRRADIATAIAGTARAERPYAQAREQAIEEARTRTFATTEARLQWIEQRLRELTASIIATVRDLYDDLTAESQAFAERIDAIRKGPTDYYRASARIAGREAARTQPGVDADQVETARLYIGAQEAEFNLAQRNAETVRQVEAAQRLAEAERQGVAAMRDAERQNQVLQFAFEARARAQALAQKAQESGDATLIANAQKISAGIEAEIAKYDELIKRQQEAQRQREAVAFNRQFDPAEQFKADMDRIQDLAATGKTSAVAVRNATVDAYIRMGRASDNFVDGAIAGLLMYQRQAEQTGAAAANAINKGLEQIEDALARLASGMTVNFKQMIQQFTYEMNRMIIRQYIMGNMMRSMQGDQQGYGGTSTPMAGGSPIMGGGGLNSLSFLSSMGGSGNVSSVGNWNGPMISGDYSAAASSGSNIGETMGGLMGGAYAGSSGRAVGGMAGGIGSFAGFLGIGMGAMQAATSKTRGGQIAGTGQAVSSALMMIPTPWTMAAGAIISIGSQIAGAIIDKKNTPHPQATSDIVYDQQKGMFVLGDGITRDGGNREGTNEAGKNIAHAVNRMAAQYGLSFLPGTAGGYILNSQGKHTGDQWIAGTGSYKLGDDIAYKYNNNNEKIAMWQSVYGQDIGVGGARELADSLSGEEAVSRVIAGIIKRAANENKVLVEGSETLAETFKTVLKNSVAQGQDELQQDLDFAKSYARIKEGKLAAQDTRDAVQETIDNIRVMRYEAQRLGLDTAILGTRMQEDIDKFATNDNEGYRRGLLGFDNPMAVALEDLAKERQEAIDRANYLKTVSNVLVDINQLEEFYGRRRQQIVEQFQGQTLTTLQGLIRRLQYGDLSGASPVNVLSGARASYEANYAQAIAGDTRAQANFAAYTQDYINAARAYYANDPRMAAIQTAVLAQTQAVQDYINLLAGSDSAASNTPLSQAENLIDTQQEQIAALSTNVASMQVSISDLTAQIGRLMSRLPTAA